MYISNEIRFLIKYCTENHSYLCSYFRALGFENPKELLTFKKDEVVTFSGWILPYYDNYVVEWLFEKNGEMVSSHVPEIVRTDVDEKYFPEIDGEKMKRGFCFSALAGTFDSVFVRNGDVKILVWNIECIDSKHKNFFSKFALSFRDLHLPKRTVKLDFLNIHDDLERNSLQNAFSVVSLEFFLKDSSFKLFDPSSAASAIERIVSPRWALEFILDNSFESESFFSNSRVSCRFSLAFDDYNFLFFSSDNECYYIVQHCATVCILFPALLTVVRLTDVIGWVDTAVDKIPFLYAALHGRESAVFNERGGCFLALNVSQSRPYHYFYDYFFGFMHLLDESNRSYMALSVAGCDFLNLNEIVPKVLYSSVSSKFINDICLDDGSFTVMPSFQYCVSGNSSLFFRYTEFLRNAVERIFIHQGKKNSSVSFILWIGISCEKRSWVEQVEGYSNIIRRLRKNNPSIHVLVDGRTFPLTPGVLDRSNKEREDLLFRQIVDLNPEVDFTNMIGMKAVEKIILAQSVDLFISNYATDSIYPSAICGRPGVVYSPPSIGDQKFLHVHRDIIEVSSADVGEVVLSNGVSSEWHHTSVSIDWRVIYKCVEKMIHKGEFI